MNRERILSVKLQKQLFAAFFKERLAKDVFAFSENLSSFNSLLIRFARWGSVTCAAFLITFIAMPSGLVVFLGFRDFIIRFISVLLACVKSKWATTLIFSLVLKMFGWFL